MILQNNLQNNIHFKITSPVKIFFISLDVFNFSAPSLSIPLEIPEIFPFDVFIVIFLPIPAALFVHSLTIFNFSPLSNCDRFFSNCNRNSLRSNFGGILSSFFRSEFIP